MKLGSLLKAVLPLLALSAVACGPDFDRMEITGQKESPLGGTVNARQISIPAGMIVKAHVVPFNDDNEMMQAHVWSEDTTVMDVFAVVNDRDYAFVANKVGRTAVTFEADGKPVLVVDAVVTEQPSPP